MAEWKDTYKIEALLTGDASGLKKAIDRAQRMLKRLESNDGDIEIDADSKPLNNRINIAKKKIRELKSESATIDINGDNSDFNKDVVQSTAMLDSLEKKASIIEMNAHGLEKLKQFQSIKVKEVDMSDAKVNVAPDFDMGAATSKIAKFKAQLRSIPNKLKTWMEVDTDFDHISLIRRLGMVTDEFQINMNKMARSIQSFATVFGNQIKGGVISSLTALVPIVASLVPAVMALGNAIGVLGGGLIGLATAFGVAGIAGVGFGGLVASVLSRYNSETFQATKESQKFTQAINGIKSTWNGIVDANMASVFTTMTNAVSGANSALSKLAPMFSGVSAVMEQASGSFQKFIDKSPIAEQFFNMLNTTGVSVFQTLLSAVGQFGAGFMQVINLLEPLMTNMANGFDNLAERFLNWSQAVGTEKNFQKFAEYVQQALPLIGSIFGSTFQGIINLFASFGDNSLIIFESLAQMAERFKQWSATIKESDGFQKFIQYVQENGPTVISLIGNVIMTIVNLGVALAPLGAVVLDVVNAFFEFTSELLKNHPIVGVLLGVLTGLFGVFMMLLPGIIQTVAAFHQLVVPLMNAFKGGTLLSTVLGLLKGAFVALVGTVGVIIGILALLVGSFIALWNTNEQFRTRVIEIWNTIKEHISNAVTAVSNFIKEIWGTLVTWWNENNTNILEVAMTIWSAILDTVEAVMTFLVPIVQVAWEKIKMIISVALDLILGIVGVFFAVLNGDWSGAWEIIKSTGLSIWETIKTGIDNILNILLGLVGTNLEKMKTKMSEIWEGIKLSAKIAWLTLKTNVLMFIAELIMSAVEKWNTFKTWMSNMWTAIKNKAVNIWNMVKTAVITLVQNIVQGAKDKFNNFKQTLSNIWNSIKSTTTNIWNAIKNWVTTTISNIVSSAKSKFNSMKSAISNILNNIKSTATSIWNSIKSFISSVISNIVSTVRSKFNQMRSTVSNVLNNIKSIATSIWNSIKSTISSVVSSVISTVRSKFNQMRSTVSSVLNNIRSVASSVWNSIRSTISSVISNIVSAVRSRFNSMRSTIVSIFNNIRSTASSVWNSIKSTISNIVNNIKSTIQRIFNSLAGIVRSAFSRVKSAVSNGMTAAYNKVTGFFSKFKTAGSNIVSNIASGISGAIGKVTSAIGNVTQRIRDHLPFSPAKRGALRDIMKTNVGGSIADTIKKQERLPIKRMQHMTKGMQGVVNGFNPDVSTDFSPISRGIKQAQLSAKASMQHNITTQMEAPNQSLTAHLHLGNRDYKAYVGDISRQQSDVARLEEEYGV